MTSQIRLIDILRIFKKHAAVVIIQPVGYPGVVNFDQCIGKPIPFVWETATIKAIYHGVQARASMKIFANQGLTFTDRTIIVKTTSLGTMKVL